MGSLQGRLLIAASAVLIAFLSLTGVGLDRAFQQSALGAVRDRLQAHVYLLLGATEVNDSTGLSVPALLPEARFLTPGSGLYGEITDVAGNSLWRSPSMLGLEIPFPSAIRPGQPVFAEMETSHSDRLFGLSFTVIWEVGGTSTRQYVFRVAESRNAFDAQVQSFRRNLWVWFALAGVALLAVQGLVLRWSLAPLRQVARELTEIEHGSRRELTNVYPREIKQLTGNLNALIRHSHEHLERSRNAMDDLAHSLKTPLAVLRAAVDSDSQLARLPHTVTEQVDRMTQSVEYQLQRAVASGRTAMIAPVPVEPVAQKVMASLRKAHHQKNIAWSITVAPTTVFYGDQSDLMEVIGNLSDNAFKWCRRQVALRAFPAKATACTDSGLVIEVEDDGPGIASAKLPHVLHRGIRADPDTAGHGIGLAVVKEIVEEIYRGSITFDRGFLGGAKVRVQFPG